LVSRIDVALNTTALPAGTRMTDLQAKPVTLLFAVPFTPAAASASKATAGNLLFTGDWNMSFALINNKTDKCLLPSQNVRCMPTGISRARS
jgi:hypothetical protein